MADKKQPTAVKFVAYAPFDFRGKYDMKAKHYEPGDEFVPRENMSRDTGFDQFRAVEKRKSENLGVSFIEVGEVISSKPEDKNNPNAERYTYRHVLPLKEA